MNKKTMYTICIIFTCIVLVIIAAYFIIKNIKKSEGKIELVYSQSAGIPFKWEYEIEDKTILKCDEAYVISDENRDGRVGGKVSTKYVFKGLKEGKTILTFKFVNFTNDEVENSDRYIVTVDKDLKATYDKVDK